MKPKTKTCCQAIDAVVSLTALIVVNGFFAIFASMGLLRFALEGWKEAAFAVPFFGVMLLFCIWFAGILTGGFLDWLRPEYSRSSKTGVRSCIFWGCFHVSPFALLGAIVPPTQEVLLFGMAAIGIAVLALAVSRVTFGLVGGL